jgi:hypothetical protein
MESMKKGLQTRREVIDVNKNWLLWSKSGGVRHTFYYADGDSVLAGIASFEIVGPELKTEGVRFWF